MYNKKYLFSNISRQNCSFYKYQSHSYTVLPYSPFQINASILIKIFGTLYFISKKNRLIEILQSTHTNNNLPL